MLIRAGQLDKAVEDLRTARASNASQPSFALHLAWAYHAKGQSDEARANFMEAEKLGLKPRDSIPLNSPFSNDSARSCFPSELRSGRRWKRSWRCATEFGWPHDPQVPGHVVSQLCRGMIPNPGADAQGNVKYQSDSHLLPRQERSSQTRNHGTTPLYGRELPLLFSVYFSGFRG